MGLVCRVELLEVRGCSQHWRASRHCLPVKKGGRHSVKRRRMLTEPPTSELYQLAGYHVMPIRVIGNLPIYIHIYIYIYIDINRYTCVALKK